MKEKILSISLPRTGNTSLCTAFGILGYSNFHGPRNWKELIQHEALTEVIPSRFESLEEIYPNARYILTIRERKSLLRSCRKHKVKALPHTKRNPPFWQHEESWEQLYDERIEYSKQFDRLLVMDICGGDGWEKLCPYLEKPIPDIPFPHKNRSASIPLL